MLLIPEQKKHVVDVGTKNAMFLIPEQSKRNAVDAGTKQKPGCYVRTKQKPCC